MVAFTTKVLFASCLVLAIGIYFYPRARDDDSFDYFYLSLQWPPSFCNSTDLKVCYKPVPDYFTIHGLWAQTNRAISNYDKPYKCDDNEKKNCDEHPFNYTELKNDTKLMEKMNKGWPNLINGSSPDQQNKKFWKHEWEKHGCCLFNFKSEQNNYFKKTCGMWEKDPPLLKIFEAHKPPITPGPDKTYFLRNYTDAIRSGLKVEPGTFICNEDKNGSKQLVEVRLCTDIDVTKFMDCPDRKPVSPSCGEDSTKIAFPRYTN